MKKDKTKVNIAVFVSGNGTNLQALIDAQKCGKIPSAQIKLVVSNNKNAFALCRAENENIPVLIAPRKIDDFEKEVLPRLAEFDIDLIVLAGFMSILSADFVNKYKNRIINIHPSLIPQFCGKGFYGLKVHQAVLSSGQKTTGATVHYVNEITDGGEIILQKEVEVSSGDTPQSLQEKVMREAEWIILAQATEMVAQRILREAKL